MSDKEYVCLTISTVRYKKWLIWGERMVMLVGYVLGALVMLGVATLFSFGLFVLPVSLILLGVGAVWANRAGKARPYWIAAMGGVVSTVVIVMVRTFVTHGSQ